MTADQTTAFQFGNVGQVDRFFWASRWTANRWNKAAAARVEERQRKSM